MVLTHSHRASPVLKRMHVLPTTTTAKTIDARGVISGRSWL